MRYKTTAKGGIFFLNVTKLLAGEKRMDKEKGQDRIVTMSWVFFLFIQVLLGLFVIFIHIYNPSVLGSK